VEGGVCWTKEMGVAVVPLRGRGTRVCVCVCPAPSPEGGAGHGEGHPHAARGRGGAITVDRSAALVRLSGDTPMAC
jgi:hypothetical protein